MKYFLTQSTTTELLRLLLESTILKTNHTLFLKEIKILNNKYSNLEKKLESFEELLMTKAENLINLPLIKKDIVNFNNDISLVKQQLENQTSIFEETQNQSRWLIGSLGLGLLASIVPLFKSSFFQ